jgi:hypothetical protein
MKSYGDLRWMVSLEQITPQHTTLTVSGYQSTTTLHYSLSTPDVFSYMYTTAPYYKLGSSSQVILAKENLFFTNDIQNTG